MVLDSRGASVFSQEDAKCRLNDDVCVYQYSHRLPFSTESAEPLSKNRQLPLEVSPKKAYCPSSFFYWSSVGTESFKSSISQVGLLLTDRRYEAFSNKVKQAPVVWSSQMDVTIEKSMSTRGEICEGFGKLGADLTGKIRGSSPADKKFFFCLLANFLRIFL